LAPWTTEANWNWLLASLYAKQPADFAAAAAALDKLQPEFLQQAEVLGKIASVYASLQQYDQAIIWYKKMVARYPNQPQVYLEILRLAKQAGQTQEVAATLAQIKTVAPNYLARRKLFCNSPPRLNHKIYAGSLGGLLSKTPNIFRRFIKFCLVGFTNSLVDFLLYWFFTRLVGWPYLLANAAAVIIAITWSFVLNTFWTWQQDLAGQNIKIFFG
jgi:tetratricopeptide (TPR) repeat protein